MQPQLGTVVSTLESPSPSRVDFVVNNGKAHKGMFVELAYSEGTMMCLVEDVLKTNRYFERPDSVKTIGEELEKNFPIADWEFLLARARPLGVFSNGQVQRSTFPPSPGTKVFVADNEHIKKFLNIEEGGLELGSIQFHDVLLKVNLSKLLQKHLALLAMSGAGKSYCVSVLLEELLRRKPEQGQIAVIAFDTHGEYTCFGEPVRSEDKNKYTDFSSKVRVIDGSKIRIAVSGLHKGLMHQVLPDLTPKQAVELSRIIARLSSEMKSGMGPYDINAIRAEVATLDPKLVDGINASLDELEALGLFGKVDSPSIADIAKPGQLAVIDLSRTISEKKRQLIVGYFSNTLFTARRHKKVPPFALLIEEAHNFIPEKTASNDAIARTTLRTIAREGRKFGASIILVSQRPKRLDVTTLANCNTNIILRITNPYDLDHIKQSSEGLDVSSLAMISSLRVGEAVIIGEATGAPTFFKVRLRTSQPSRHETTLEEAARAFAADDQKKTDEVDAFL